MVTFERGFAVLAATLLVLSVGAVVAVPSDAKRDGTLAFDPGVPAEYSFETPTEDGVATVDGETYESVNEAVAAADPGETVRLTGVFHERVTVDTDGITLTSADGAMAVIDGGGVDDVLTLDGEDITVRRLWIRNSGSDASGNDAGVWINGTGATVIDSRLTEITFGLWVDGVDDVVIENNTIVGRESVRPLSYRGNGIQLWKTESSRVTGNHITDVRDGIYYSWASEVLANQNVMWDLRYGVHYMYSDDCRLVNNTAFGNDVGYSLMVSQRLEIVNNIAVNNHGKSGHGFLVKSIDKTTIRGNVLIGNRKGMYVFNSLDNVIVDNLVMANDVGVHLLAGSVREDIYNNSFVRNDEPVRAVIGQQVAWNRSGVGNYWSGASTADVDGDGMSDVRYRPAGIVERLMVTEPISRVFADSPAFSAIRMAESSVPVIESPGVIDYHPRVEPKHDWRRYYD